MADNDHDHDDGQEVYSGEESHLPKNAPASAYFKRIIRNMNIVTAVFLALIFGLAIATIIVLNSGPWDQRDVWRKEVSQSVLRSLAICVSSYSSLFSSLHSYPPLLLSRRKPSLIPHTARSQLPPHSPHPPRPTPNPHRYRHQHRPLRPHPHLLLLLPQPRLARQLVLSPLSLHPAYATISRKPRWRTRDI